MNNHLIDVLFLYWQWFLKRFLVFFALPKLHMQLIWWLICKYNLISKNLPIWSSNSFSAKDLILKGSTIIIFFLGQAVLLVLERNQVLQNLAKLEKVNVNVVNEVEKYFDSHHKVVSFTFVLWINQHFSEPFFENLILYDYELIFTLQFW